MVEEVLLLCRHTARPHNIDRHAKGRSSGSGTSGVPGGGPFGIGERDGRARSDGPDAVGGLGRDAVVIATCQRREREGE